MSSRLEALKANFNGAVVHLAACPEVRATGNANYVSRAIIAHILLANKLENLKLISFSGPLTFDFSNDSKQAEFSLVRSLQTKIERIGNGKFKIDGYAKALQIPSSLRLRNSLLRQVLVILSKGFSSLELANEITPKVLGALYENSLNIQLTKSVSSKDLSQRKKNGSFYTPDHVVGEMLTASVTALKANLNEIRICEPAVGSGQFLRHAIDLLQGTGRNLSSIVERNFYGIDIDPGAVLFCKFTLWIALIDRGCHSLPSLSRNIQTFNSLLDSKKISEMPKFDLVIGNPPYGKIVQEENQAQYRKRFKGFLGNLDIFSCFLEFAPTLLKRDGIFSFIVPSMWLAGDQFKELRKCVLANKTRALYVLRGKVFKDASVDTCIYIGSNIASDSTQSNKIDAYEVDAVNSMTDRKVTKVDQRDWLNDDDLRIIWNGDAQTVLKKLERMGFGCLGELVEIKRGVRLSANHLTERPETKMSFRFFEGSMKPYQTEYYAPKWAEFSDKLPERPRDAKWFQGDRILLRRIMGKDSQFVADLASKDFLTSKSFYSILPKDKAIDLEIALAIINSRTFGRIYALTHPQACKSAFPQITISSLESMPFPKAENFAGRSSQIKRLVLEVKNSSNDVRRQKALLKIEEIVQELYSLTQNEISSLDVAA